MPHSTDGGVFWRSSPGNAELTHLSLPIHELRQVAAEPVLDLSFLIDYVMEEVKPLRWDEVLASPIPLKIVASCLDQLRPVILEVRDNGDEPPFLVTDAAEQACPHCRARWDMLPLRSSLLCVAVFFTLVLLVHLLSRTEASLSVCTYASVTPEYVPSSNSRMRLTGLFTVPNPNP